MAARRKSPPRKRVGSVSYYLHHGAWYVYYRDGGRVIRKRVALTEAAAAKIAAELNAQLATGAATQFDFQPLSVAELRRRFLQHHEQVLGSSQATVQRYRTATLYLENFAREFSTAPLAHEIKGSEFVAWLRRQKISPNGHPHSAKRPLLDKGLRYVIEVCRSQFTFAAQNRHLPPYQSQPFSNLQIDRLKIEDAKPIFVFDAEAEFRFFERADQWSFPIHLTLAKTGLRVGELVHLLIEDVDWEAGWLHIRNKADLGWKVKTRRERIVPVIAEVRDVLRRVVQGRTAGPVFIRQQFDWQNSALGNSCWKTLAQALRKKQQALARDAELSAAKDSQLARSIWRDAGAIRAERIRSSFIRIAKHAGCVNATCPKSWRHTFATLLQDANVDPLIRQITLGHKPTDDAHSGLGMTSVYTHTRKETQKREIERALHFWPRTLELASR